MWASTVSVVLKRFTCVRRLAVKRERHAERNPVLRQHQVGGLQDVVALDLRSVPGTVIASISSPLKPCSACASSHFVQNTLRNPNSPSSTVRGPRNRRPPGSRREPP